jgi:di/tripeptidase
MIDMNAIAIDPAELRSLIKSAVDEAMREHAASMREVVDETLEDMALGRAILEAKDSPTMSVDEFFASLAAES